MSGFRRTWDKSLYEEKARERYENGDTVDEPQQTSKRQKKEEFVPADEGAEGPIGSERAFIHARKGKVDLESKVGKIEVVDPNNVERGAGYWCEVCACLLKDSASYLDHINGKKHQRALGFSMRVERADVDKVKLRMDTIKQSIASAKTAQKNRPSSIEAHDLRVAAALAEEEERKRKKKEVRARKELEQEEVEVDPEMAQLLGFGGFSSSKR